MCHDPIPIVCQTHGGLMSPYREVIGTDCPMCAFVERDRYREALDKIAHLDSRLYPEAVSIAVDALETTR